MLEDVQSGFIALHLLDREQIAQNKSLLTVLFPHPACDYNVSGNLLYVVSSST